MPRVWTEVLTGRRKVAFEAIVLAITKRQVGRLLIRFREGGGGGLALKGRGRSSNHRVNAGVREYALELVRMKYDHVGPTLAIEMLESKHANKVSREILRGWMVEARMWLAQVAPERSFADRKPSIGDAKHAYRV